MFYFNSSLRLRAYCHGNKVRSRCTVGFVAYPWGRGSLRGCADQQMPVWQADGMDNCYDCAAETWVLEQWLRRRGIVDQVSPRIATLAALR
jgi:hypothetical protein